MHPIGLALSCIINLCWVVLIVGTTAEKSPEQDSVSASVSKIAAEKNEPVVTAKLSEKTTAALTAAETKPTVSEAVITETEPSAVADELMIGDFTIKDIIGKSSVDLVGKFGNGYTNSGYSLSYNIDDTYNQHDGWMEFYFSDDEVTEIYADPAIIIYKGRALIWRMMGSFRFSEVKVQTVAEPETALAWSGM